jgi:hypothetical protein
MFLKKMKNTLNSNLKNAIKFKLCDPNFATMLWNRIAHFPGMNWLLFGD